MKLSALTYVFICCLLCPACSLLSDEVSREKKDSEEKSIILDVIVLSNDDAIIGNTLNIYGEKATLQLMGTVNLASDNHFIFIITSDDLGLFRDAYHKSINGSDGVQFASQTFYMDFSGLAFDGAGIKMIVRDLNGLEETKEFILKRQL